MRFRLGLALAVIAGVVALTGCGSSNSTTAAAPGAAATSSTAASATSTASGSGGTSDTSSCGPKPGVAATGTPIVLGAINTKQPGTDFTDISNMASAYFACVNANGGVNGHPIKLQLQTEATQPPQIAAASKLLVQTDHVLGVAGTSIILECTIDHTYWEKLDYKVIAAGIAPECYSTSNYADVNMGPRYSSDGAVQYAISQHPSTIVFDPRTSRSRTPTRWRSSWSTRRGQTELSCSTSRLPRRS